jgi:hypothetical protein
MNTEQEFVTVYKAIAKLAEATTILEKIVDEKLERQNLAIHNLGEATRSLLKSVEIMEDHYTKKINEMENDIRMLKSYSIKY